MTTPVPPTDAQLAAWRSARRDAARRHHPDLGGDADALVRALAEVDRRFGRVTGAADTTPHPPYVVRRTRRNRLRRWVTKAGGRAAARRPGAPTWIDL